MDYWSDGCWVVLGHGVGESRALLNFFPGALAVVGAMRVDSGVLRAISRLFILSTGYGEVFVGFDLFGGFDDAHECGEAFAVV